jgi:hypothetical protein
MPGAQKSPSNRPSRILVFIVFNNLGICFSFKVNPKGLNPAHKGTVWPRLAHPAYLLFIVSTARWCVADRQLCRIWSSMVMATLPSLSESCLGVDCKCFCPPARHSSTVQ